MATIKELEVWLSHLQNTMNFEWIASQVFDRIVHGKGRGLIILQGPSKIANKSFFLKMVKAFQRGVPFSAKTYFSEGLQRLLAEVGASRYQCVDVKDDCPVGDYPHLYRVPVDLAMPLSMAISLRKTGLRKGCKLVILCDDLNDFLHYNQESNITFLKQLGDSLQNFKDMTFLGAYALNPSDYKGDGLKGTALSSFVLPLGYD